jgi:hypothetical protein
MTLDKIVKGSLACALLGGQLVWADSLQVDFPKSPRFPVFEFGEKVEMSITAQRDNPAAEEDIAWSVSDYLGRTVKEGTIRLNAGEADREEKVILENLPAGYMEVRAQMGSTELPARGSRPAGMATFGVTNPLEALELAHPDESRFGIQGTNFLQTGIFLQGNPYNPLYTTLGVRWVNVSRNWADAEPDRPGQYLESLKNKKPSEADYIPQEKLAPLTCVAYLPWWALKGPEGVKINQKDSHVRHSYPPTDESQYAAYLRALAGQLSRERVESYPALRAVYYQVGWEPDWHWKGTDEEFVSLYRTAYAAIKAGDPNAVVLGPGYGVTATGVKLLERLLPMGLDEALDGIAIHGYYVPFGNPKATSVEGKYVSPEEGKMVETLRELKGLMAKYFKPGAKLFQTEWGLDYRGRYKDLDPALLRRQAAYVIRGHILFLGEGCDITYFFYTADYGNLDKQGEDGYGLCFNLTMPKPSFGATRVSPKPVFMGGCTLTRVLEGTKTLGPVALGEGMSAYAFDRAGQHVLAFWSGDNADRTVQVPVFEGATGLDIMGNPLPLEIRDGVATVKSSMFPAYILGVNSDQLSKPTNTSHE